MRLVTRLLIPGLCILALGLCVAPRALHAQSGACCVVPDNGTGTADHVPSCPTGYVGYMEIVNGLPPGSVIQIPATLGGPPGFTGLVQTPGGSLGGMSETWQSAIQMQMTGTGVFSTYSRALSLPISSGNTDSAPRTPFAPVQSFVTDLVSMQGQMPFGDPDFDLLRVTAGTAFGLPSPGQTIFTASGPAWEVDSFFDITYRIDFIGSPTGPFAGMSGSTTQVYRFEMCHAQPTPVRPGTWGAVKVLYR